MLISTISNGTFALEQDNAGRTTDKSLLTCPAVIQAKNQLDKWIVPALNSSSSIGCPSTPLHSVFSKLDGIVQSGGECSKEAASTLIAFYAIFANHPNYSTCGLQEKQEILLSKIADDGKICVDQPTDKINDCFLKVSVFIANLKSRGEIEATFELAKKTADSNDVTGISQMYLGIMYDLGEGTQKNVPLALYWLNEALKRTDDKSTRDNLLVALGAAYEEINDYKDAKNCFVQCAVMGDNDCTKAMARLNQS